MTRDATTAFARTLVDELARGGVTEAVVSPGSRSAPVALALAAEPRIRVRVVLDERAAAFFALGIGRASGCPAVVLTTSGTAAANLHPAVLEAHHAGVPLIVCTADRPPELRGVGAPQTIDQVNLFGAATRWFVDVEVPEDRPGVGDEWRTLAARAVGAARGDETIAGPVHLNLGFRDPLVPTGDPLVDAPGRSGGEPFLGARAAADPVDRTRVATLAARVRSSARGVLVLGGDATVSSDLVSAFASASGWPVLADPGAGTGAFPETIRTSEALVRVSEFAAGHRPDTWIRIGSRLTSSTVSDWLDSVPGVVVDRAGPWRDPTRGRHERIDADATAVLEQLVGELAPRSSTASASASAPAPRAWADEWCSLDAVAIGALDATIDAWPELSEPRVARDVVAAVPSGGALVVGSSMPIRDVTWFARPRRDLRVIANRGVNGIDGFLATALGVAAVHPGPTVALCGDLSFLHDTGGLAAAAASDCSLVIVVVDNRGGGIFSFLPQASLPEHFEALFGTPPAVDLAAVARGYGVPVTTVTDRDGIGPALTTAIGGDGPQVLHVRTDRVRNVEQHQELWAAVELALRRHRGPAGPA